MRRKKTKSNKTSFLKKKKILFPQAFPTLFSIAANICNLQKQKAKLLPSLFPTEKIKLQFTQNYILDINQLKIHLKDNASEL